MTGLALTFGGNSAGIYADGGNTVTIGATSSVTVGSANISVTLGTNRLSPNAATVLLNQGIAGFAAGATSSTLNISTFQGNGGVSEQWNGPGQRHRQHHQHELAADEPDRRAGRSVIRHD